MVEGDSNTLAERRGDDLTEALRAREGTAYLAAAGRLLERFDPETTFQAIVDLAVPVLADWCFIHLMTDGELRLVAIANVDPSKVAVTRVHAAGLASNYHDTPLGRVLAGGGAEVVNIDDALRESWARDASHLEHLRREKYRSAVIAPLPGRDGVLGAVVFVMAASGRKFGAADRDVLIELSRCTGIALDNARLLAAEQSARRNAEEARDRTRQLQHLTEMLSRTNEQSEIMSIMVSAGRDALGAYSGLAWLLRDEHTLELGAYEHNGDPGRLEQFRVIPMTTPVPVCDVVRSGKPMMFESQQAMKTAYPLAVAAGKSPISAWAVLPMLSGDRVLGAVSFPFAKERHFSDDDRELLAAVIGQASIALERARLHEAVKVGEERLRSALVAAHAGTWTLDLKTMMIVRDPSYRELLDLPQSKMQANADFGSVHPDDRWIARGALERTLRDGTPYEPEVRVERGDGTYMWTRAHGRVTYSADGKPAILSGVIVDIDEAKRASLRVEEERRVNETLHRLGSTFASELDHDRLVRLITLEVAKLVGAEVGAFYEGNADGSVAALHSLFVGAGDVVREGTAPTLVGANLRKVVRCSDCRCSRHVEDGPLSFDHPAFRSCLGVPVMARSGGFFGLLLFGHPETDRFTQEHERLATGIAGQAAIALENARLYRTVREQKEQLEVAVERVRLADRRKDEFLAMLGHELRNPLAPIVTALALMELKNDPGSSSERDVIKRQVDHMRRLVDDLLDISRITRGKIQLSKQVIEIGTIVAKAAEMTSPLFERRFQELVVDVPKEGLLVTADPTRLSQVFQNLLTNASKYSDEKSRVVIVARAEDDRTVIEVLDEGIGIAPELLPRLFDSFVQGERAIDRGEGGLGLGLTIAKSLCELHGGTICVATEGPGKGSRFTVSLPRASEAPNDAPMRAEPRRSRPGGGRRVLVVDDNVDAARTLYALLSELGHVPAVAYDGVVALELAQSFKPNIALLDIGLPVMDGYELAGRLRAQLGEAALRLIAVTGYGQDGDRARAKRAGFNHHLVKPITVEALVTLLDGDPGT
jgi:PAS domain S-box-containing protein